MGSNTEGIEVRSVGNSQTLQETALVEAFNLKAAIEYLVPNCMYLHIKDSNVILIRRCTGSIRLGSSI